ncbi:MAG: hypothetical protein ACFFCW_09525 [Candidatus Hodarchaeota archaeon]
MRIKKFNLIFQILLLGVLVLGCVNWIVPGKARTHSEPVSAVVHGTWRFDFETGNEGSTPGSDFWWEQETSTKRFITPQHGAQVTNLGERTAAFNEIDYVYATRLTYSTAKIDGSTTNNQIPKETVLLWRSAEGNYVKMRIDTYGYDLSFTYEMLSPDDAVVVYGTWSFDFETGQQETSPDTDFWWEQVTSTTRYLTPQHGAQVTNLGTTIAYKDINYAYAEGLTYSTTKVDGSTTNNQIPEGTVLVWRSAEGNYVKMLIASYGYDLCFIYEIIKPTIFTLVSPILTQIITGITPSTTTPTTPETSEGQPGIPGWEFYVGIIAIVTLLCFRRRRSN